MTKSKVMNMHARHAVTMKLKKGMVGIEAAIVLIAFVIVAAALAFVVLNMGFMTTQKSSIVIRSGLGEASTALEVDGSVIAYSAKSTKVNYTVIPIKVSPGRHLVDLHPDRTNIMYWSTEAGSYADIYVGYGYIYKSSGSYYLIVYKPDGTTWVTSTNIGSSINLTKIWDELRSSINEDVYAVVLWVDSNQDHTKKDTNLEVGEKAIIMVVYKSTNVQPTAYQTIKLEVKPPEGATLTVEKTMPPGIPKGVIDLG